MYAKNCGKCKWLSNSGNCTYMGLFIKVKTMKICPKGSDYQKLMANLL